VTLSYWQWVTAFDLNVNAVNTPSLRWALRCTSSGRRTVSFIFHLGLNVISDISEIPLK